MLSSRQFASFFAVAIALILSGCKGAKSSGASAETASAESPPARPSESFVGQSSGTAASLLKHLRQLDTKYVDAKQDDVETSHANLLAYSRAMEQTADALLAHKDFPNDARMMGAKVKLKSIRDRIDLDPGAFDQFQAAADALEREDPKSLIPQLAAFARFETISSAPISSFATPKVHLQKTVDALVKLANVEPPLPVTAQALENFGLMAEMRDEPKTSAMLFDLLGKRFPDHPAFKFVPGSVHRLELRGKPVTEIQGKDFDGKPIDLKDYRGKIVLVDFWASWCKPCADEMPDLKEMRRNLQPLGFEILGVCIDEDARKGQYAVESTRMPWPQIHDQRDPEGFASKLATAFGIAKIPHKLLINPQGVLVGSAVDLKELAPAVTALLKDQAQKKLDELEASKAKKSADDKKPPEGSKQPEKTDSKAVDAPKSEGKKP